METGNMRCTRVGMRMGLNWPGVSSVGGDMGDEARIETKQLIDEFGDALARNLARLGLPEYASPFFRPFSLVISRDESQVLLGLAAASGVSELFWIDHAAGIFPPAEMASLLTGRLNWKPSAIVALPLANDPRRAESVEAVAAAHAKEAETMSALSKLGNIDHVRHLEPDLRTFLEDHPEPSRNVFIMMRFGASEQMTQIHSAIVAGLAEHGMNAVRADDRDYTGELWSNIEVYLTGCQYGIAVFEDIEQRDYNPNVSLELGYLMGRGKRTLLLKEKRLPNMPSDVVHRLYKEFDGYDIENSVKREVATWITRDLRI
ncbi:hypothetical protein [Frigoribacterium sp. SL97]|uniref:hypothetical protein n=1 Tax=Frigoribacterium sp. SL97 TaxID=2994664 RepID=UPI00226E3229|nr:hypothetical protein [Frigoribacterium sp. SL97]WAC53240.1 hypothetical protein OVA02_08435 [Frigoribacterium sp. SL97]